MKLWHENLLWNDERQKPRSNCESNNNNKKQLVNQRTEPVNNVCSFNDDKIALQKQTMHIQLAVDNNIVQIHYNIVWKISRKNVLREAYLDKHLSCQACFMTSHHVNI